MSRRQDWANWSPTVDQIEAQVSACIERGEEFLDWLACDALSDDMREPSPYFGEISSVGLFREVGMNPDATPDQCKAVFAELRRRFTDERHELLEALAKEQAIREFPEDERARLEAA